MRNPVTTKKYYRLYLIHKIPQLRLIDFQKVKLRVSDHAAPLTTITPQHRNHPPPRNKEREAARKIFKGRRGKEFFRDIGKKTKTFVAGKPIETPGDILVKEMTKAQIQDISDIKVCIVICYIGKRISCYGCGIRRLHYKIIVYLGNNNLNSY